MQETSESTHIHQNDVRKKNNNSKQMINIEQSCKPNFAQGRDAESVGLIQSFPKQGMFSWTPAVAKGRSES